MTVRQLKSAAQHQEQPNPEWTCAERAFFYAMRDLYAKFKTGSLSKEEGERLTSIAEKQFKKDEADFLEAKKIIANNAEMWKRIEFASHRYIQERTVENANAFVEAVYGVKLKTEETA